MARDSMNLLRVATTLVAVGLLSSAAQHPAFAQQTQVQIPTLQVCNKSVVVGRGVITIDARRDMTHSGSFKLEIEASCDPQGAGYPGGSIAIRAISLTDSTITGDIDSLGPAIEQMTSTGSSTPTAYISGRCTHHPPTGAGIAGCRFWLLIVDNQEVTTQRRTPDIVSVLVFDGAGRTVFYATGPVVSGSISVTH